VINFFHKPVDENAGRGINSIHPLGFRWRSCFNRGLQL